MSSPPDLAARHVASTDHASRTIVMLHGIDGRGRNWLGIARALVAARPEYACWLVDLPHHGESEAGSHGDGVLGFAADLHDWAEAHGVKPDAVLGHSYGGKVALAFATRPRSRPAATASAWRGGWPATWCGARAGSCGGSTST